MTTTASPDPRDDEHVADGSSLMGFLHVLRKGHIALVGRDAAHRRFAQVHTRAHARKYIEELMPQLLRERDRRRHARR
jgi:hypothetical protein